MLNFEKIKKKNMSLIGLMGSGKSIIGRDLAKKYNIEFFDSDTEIEIRLGKNINEIFSHFGEEYFRKIEQEVCHELLFKNNCIISLGGGSILSKKVRNLLKKYSYSIFLKVDISVLSKRLKNSNKRPLLIDSNIEVKLSEIYKKREKFYNNANLIIDNNLNKKEIIENIHTKISTL